MKFSQKNIENWQSWKMTFFWVCHFEFFFPKKKNVFILMKISHKLCTRMDGTQFLWLWWFTANIHSPQTFQPAVYMIKLLSHRRTVVLESFISFYFRIWMWLFWFTTNGRSMCCSKWSWTSTEKEINSLFNWRKFHKIQ